MNNLHIFAISLIGFLKGTTSFSPMTHDLSRPLPLHSTLKSRKRSLSFLCQAASSDDSPNASSSVGTSVRFLGRGKNAIVRPGVVLVAPPDEFHHFLREAAVFVYAMGNDEDDLYVIRGAIIDHPTPFTIHEMMSPDALDGGQQEETEDYLQNLLYRGGESGDAVFMLHSDEKLGGEAEQGMIGTSGVFQGGLDFAMSNDYTIDPEKCKFFFSYMEFTEAELEEMLENREDDSTQWVSVEVPSDFILNSGWERGEAWARLRNAVREK